MAGREHCDSTGANDYPLPLALSPSLFTVLFFEASRGDHQGHRYFL